MMMVEAGMGVGILSELILRKTYYNLVRVPLNPPITRAISIGYKDKNTLPIASKKFINYFIG